MKLNNNKTLTKNLELIDGINTWEQRITKKLNKKKRKEGVENLQLVQDQDLKFVPSKVLLT